MSDEVPSNTAKNPRRRQRSQRSKLRRETYLDQVRVEEPFLLNHPHSNVGEDRANSAGEGCYVTATFNSRRFYGVLIDQAALKSASLLHFQEEASGLDLNRRMRTLSQQRQRGSPPHDRDIVMECQDDSADDTKNHGALNGEGQSSRKRQRNTDSDISESLPNNLLHIFPKQGSRSSSATHQVEKFRYVVDDDPNQAYREFLATFAHVEAAADGDPVKMKIIQAACDSGGDFVGEYYFQYEPRGTALESSQGWERLQNPEVMRTAMGFETFLRKTSLPEWFPLSNLESGQQQVLSILNLKKDNKGNVLWDERENERGTLGDFHGIVIPVQPRSCYRVCVVGGGIAGLSSCLEIFRRCERDHIKVEVVLLEGRSRLGGRLWTDRETFKRSDGVSPFPVDLGASWIHGIDLNPLASLAQEAGINFVRTTEDVKMFKGGMQEVDPEKDQRAGFLFDKLLDIAADRSWGEHEVLDETVSRYRQAAVRWYASVLGTGSPRFSTPPIVDVGDHRRSTDLSVDRAVGNVIASQVFEEFQALSGDERRMLLWNLKNVEYALGANMSDLSMKFWDIDERHAFEGDHVILQQGYSVIVDHLFRQLQARGDKFQYHLNFVVDKIEYARKTMSLKNDNPLRAHQLVDISDTCCVSSKTGDRIPCDMVVCCVPLGVLKDAVSEATEGDVSSKSKISFLPSLPFTKRDAIEAVGFGLLDKVYLQFSAPFWRTGPCGLAPEQTSFGNASGVNSHHYMFFDIGKSLGKASKDPVIGKASDEPAILMSLVSGREAVKCERMTESELVQETLETLRTIYSADAVPDPIAFRITRWGSDPFSRGSYTFLPPGTTDQDFQTLQSPVNGNGDSILLDGSETMRLFFAGEHTTAMHPSMAHGALLSGVRAGEEVVSALSLSFSTTDDALDKVIPLAVFRFMNPKAPLECCFCHQIGGRTYEGPLLAFKRGSRQVLAHNACAEFSPEVEVEEGRWRHVLKAVNRSATMECCVCKSTGASIGCNHDNCYRCFHFKCAEGTGWKFEEDGKEFYCDLHRPDDSAPSLRQAKGSTQESTFQHDLFASSSPSQGMDASRDNADPRWSPGQTAAFSDDGPDPETLEEMVRAGKLTCASAGDDGDDLRTKPGGTPGARLVRLRRPSTGERWNLELRAAPVGASGGESVLLVESGRADDPAIDSVEGRAVRSINGHRIGSRELDTVQKVVRRLAQEVDVLMELDCGDGEED